MSDITSGTCRTLHAAVESRVTTNPLALLVWRMTDDADAGFFRNLGGLATEFVRQKRKDLASTTPQTEVDQAGASPTYSFSGQELTFDDLHRIKDIREGGGQVAQLMHSKALLNFGEGAEFTHDTEDGDPATAMIEGAEMTLTDWLDRQFPHLDLLVLDLGEDALWYPFAVGEMLETRAGDFKEFLPAEPWTLLPETNGRGEIVRWHQRVERDGQRVEKTLSADDIESIVLNKRSARDKVGISEVLRNDDEIHAFKENEQAISQAIELHGFPQRHVKVGKEDGAPLRDNDLRRVRTVFDPKTTDANTAYFTGQDVDVETLEAHQFDYAAIHEMDMRNLTTALGLPLEAGNVGSDGLGSGKPAELRFAILKLNIKANQRSFATQFIEQVVRPAIRDYSPFDHTADVSLRIDDPLEDIGQVADLINAVGDYMTNAEARKRLDLPAPNDEETAESYRSPADIERAEEGDGEQGGLDGLFGSDAETRTLADIPEKYTDGTGLSESDFVPNADVERVVEDAAAFIDEHGLPNPEDQREGAARVNQLLNHARNDDPLAPEFWQEISNFHARHRAQGNNVCDESTLPAEATEIDNSEFDKCYFDNGWFSDKTWGGDPGKEQADRIVDAIESTDGVELSVGDSDPFENRTLGEGITDAYLGATEDWEAALLELHGRIWDSDTDQHLLNIPSFSQTPEFVRDRIRETILDGAIFSEFESIPSSERNQLREYLTETLSADGWSIDGLTDQLMELEGLEDRSRAENIARTETASVLNNAREGGYEEQGLGDERFYWSGDLDGRTTEACRWLIQKTNPFHGGDPVPMDELKQLIDEAPEHDSDMADDLARPEDFVIHPQERKTFVRYVPGMV